MMGFFKKKKDERKLSEKLSSIERQPPIERNISKEEQFEPHFSFKIVLIGHNDSGKISTIERFGNSWFEANTKLTLGISFEVKEIQIEDLNIKLQIWDLVTEERWRALVPYYCRGALGAILIFDVSNLESLSQLSKWVQIIKANTTNIPLILLGNLEDSNRPRMVSVEMALDFVRSEGLNGYFECNIVKGEKLEHVFDSLTRLIIKRYEKTN
jgi:small GTP-binding protein